MDLANALQYKDLHGDLTIPKISTKTLKNYLDAMDKSMDDKAKKYV